MDASVAQSDANWHQSEPAEVGALEEHVETLTVERCKPARGVQHEPMAEKSQLAKLTEENAALSTEVASLKAALAAAEAETQRVATERDEALQLKAELESAHAAPGKKAAEQRTVAAQVKEATNAQQQLSTEVPAAAPSVHPAADALEAHSALARKRGPPQDSPDGLSEEESKLRRSDQRE